MTPSTPTIQQARRRIRRLPLERRTQLVSTHWNRLLRPRHPRAITGLEKLAAAVIRQAVWDAQRDISRLPSDAQGSAAKDKQSARWFLLRDNPMLRHWCDVLGLRQERVHETASVALEIRTRPRLRGVA
jgi:hypothetical protein